MHFYYKRPPYTLGVKNGTPNMLREVILTLSLTGRDGCGAAMGQVIQFSRKEVALGSGHGEGSIDAMAGLLQRKNGLKKSL
jgi:hypothetical protein